MGFAVFGLVFAIFWCLVALSMGAGFMLIFGLPFVGFMAFRLGVMAKHGEEGQKQPPRQTEDPWDQQEFPQRETQNNGFCPYCGSAVEETFEYCPKCGRKLN